MTNKLEITNQHQTEIIQLTHFIEKLLLQYTFVGDFLVSVMNTRHSSVINLILFTSYHVTLPSQFCVTISLYLLKHFVIIGIYAYTVLELLTLEHYLLTNDSQGPRFEPWRP